MLELGQLRDDVDARIMALRQALGGDDVGIIRDRIGELAAASAQLVEPEEPSNPAGDGASDGTDQTGEDAESVPETEVGA